jgi:hypothetical protein
VEEEGPGTGSLLETGNFAELRHFFIEDPDRLTIQAPKLPESSLVMPTMPFEGPA